MVARLGAVWDTSSEGLLIVKQKMGSKVRSGSPLRLTALVCHEFLLWLRLVASCTYLTCTTTRGAITALPGFCRYVASRATPTAPLRWPTG